MTPMGKTVALAGALAVLLAVPAAFADTLKYANGGQEKGMIEGVNFTVDGLPGFYLRDNIAAITLTEDGKDTLTAADGAKQEGKLVSVRMKTSDGILAVARKQLAAIELKVEEVEARKPETQAETKPEATLSPEQNASLAKNKELRTEYVKQAGDELEKFKSKQTGWKAAVDQVKQLETSIQTKEQARRQRENQPHTYTDASGRTRQQNQQKLNYNDGLDRDIQALGKARDKLATMEQALTAEKTKIVARVNEKEKSVQRVFVENRKAIAAGNIPSEEAMTARYKGALAADTKKEPKGAAAKAERKEAAAAKGEE